MPVIPTYPGVYIEEIPSGVRTITGVSTSVTAFVGYTARGPLDQAVRLFNFGDFERQFGGLNRDSLVSYAVQQFFLNGGTDAYVVRVAKDAEKAALNLDDLTGTVVLNVTAATEGVWGNLVRLSIDYATSAPDSTFNLTVRRYEKRADGSEAVAETEQFRNLSMNSQSAAHAPDVINASSRLIRLARAGGLTFNAQGFVLSRNLSPFPALTAQDRIIQGILDGNTPFTLTLTSTPATIADLAIGLDAAITAAGLGTRLDAERANAQGATDAAGTFVRLVSTATNETSSVLITPSTSLSAVLGLGVAAGGREKEGASSRRPAPNGTFGGDLAAITSVAGDFDITITDRATNAVLFPMATATLPNTPTADLPAALQALIRGVNPAASEVTVTREGTALRVTPGGTNPNLTITLADTGATAARLDVGADALNVAEYSLGVGVAFGAQSGAVAGLDGTLPAGADFKGSFDAKTGMYALRDVDIFNLLCIPETTILSESEATSVIQEAVSFCEKQRAFYLIDPDPRKDATTINAWAASVSTSRNAAVFFPEVQIADPLNGFRLRNFPPSGTMAGVFARIDANRGVWKAPAGTEAVLQGVQGLRFKLTDPENGVLNPQAVNCLRSFATYGLVSWGARTRRGADAQADEYKYIPVRRLALYIEESLFRGTQWAVFEPNDEPLWAQIRLNLGAFMNTLFRQGAFQGKTPREAYFVKCDKETTTQNDIDRGIVNIVVGFAPLKPAEFVIIKIQQIAGQIAS